jgi:hypothetical protein
MVLLSSYFTPTTLARNKTKGYFLTAALVMVGAWFHEPIMDKLHEFGIAKKHS